MSVGEDAENFVRESLANHFDASEVKPDRFELVNSSQQALGLRARDQLFIAEARKFNWNYCFCERVIRARRILVEYFLNGAGTRTTRVVLCNQARVLDLQASHARFLEKAPTFIVDEVLARLATLID